MLMKSVAPALTLLAALLLAGPVHAQTSPAKKELVAKLLKLQQPGIENMARGMAVQPAAQMMQQVSVAVQSRVPADKREAMGKEIQGDLKKYEDETVPVVRASALKLAPTTIGVVLEEKFTEDELKQIIAIMENPVNRKFQAMNVDMQRALAEKLVPDVRPTIETKIKELDRSIATRLGITPGAPAAK